MIYRLYYAWRLGLIIDIFDTENFLLNNEIF